VLNHMLYALVSQTRGRNTRRLMIVFNNLPDRDKNWWIVTPLEVASALPLLRYYATLPSPTDQHQQLAALIGSLQRRNIEPEKKKAACCEPTAACLRSILGEQSAQQPEIRSERSARHLVSSPIRHHRLPHQLLRAVEPQGHVVPLPSSAPSWEYLYDCWRWTDLAASRQPKPTRE
jgi:hypothetical protein